MLVGFHLHKMLALLRRQLQQNKLLSCTLLQKFAFLHLQIKLFSTDHDHDAPKKMPLFKGHLSQHTYDFSAAFYYEKLASSTATTVVFFFGRLWLCPFCHPAAVQKCKCNCWQFRKCKCIVKLKKACIFIDFHLDVELQQDVYQIGVGIIEHIKVTQYTQKLLLKFCPLKVCYQQRVF